MYWFFLISFYLLESGKYLITEHLKWGYGHFVYSKNFDPIEYLPQEEFCVITSDGNNAKRGHWTREKKGKHFY